MSKCSYCETLVDVVKKQTETDEAVSNGKITDGKYLEICITTKKLYENLLKLCECKDGEDSEDDEMIVDVVVVTHNNTRDLVGLPGNFISEYLGKQVYVSDEIYDGNKKKVLFIENNSLLRHIYYDENARLGRGMFTEEFRWVDRFL